MKSIRIKNLRSLIDTNRLEIKPLTITVGRNSCGKSTLLRIFPLLKQTLETKTSTPILWYGPYTDFGDFKQAINRKHKNELIEFWFEFEMDEIYNRRNTDKNIIGINFKMDEYAVKELNIFYLENKVNIIFNKSKIEYLNINDTIFNSEEFVSRKNESNIIPSIINSSEFELDFNWNPLVKYKEIFLEKALKNSKNCAEDYDDKKFERFFYNFVNLTQVVPEFKFNRSMSSRNLVGKEYGKIIIDLVNEDKNFKSIIIAYKIDELINYCNNLLNNRLTSISYIAPIRATAERYYRQQGLYVQEVDPRGENLPHILDNMDDDEKCNFSEWVESNFNFSIKTNRSEGHISLYIVNGTEEINIADTGFGYSQILPILLILWKSINNKENVVGNDIIFHKFSRRYPHRLVVIEQPELHLHPKMQSQFIKLIAAIMKMNSNSKIRFIIETHSEHIINQIGELISEDKISSKDVSVLRVDSMDSAESFITPTYYSESGYLKNWPIDFF